MTADVKVIEKVIKVNSVKDERPMYYDYSKVVRKSMPIGKSQHGVIPPPYDEVQKRLDEVTKKMLKEFGYIK